MNKKSNLSEEHIENGDTTFKRKKEHCKFFQFLL